MAARKQAPKKARKSEKNGDAATRGFTVVLEQLQGQFQVFGEALTGLSDRMNAGFEQVDRRFQQVDRRFEQVERELGLVKTAVLEHSRELKEHRRLLEDHGRMLEDHGRELKELRVGVEELAAKKVERDEVEGIIERVIAPKDAH